MSSFLQKVYASKESEGHHNAGAVSEDDAVDAFMHYVMKYEDGVIRDKFVNYISKYNIDAKYAQSLAGRLEGIAAVLKKISAVS